jgi:L-2-hydroxyglutarate oxidase
MGGKVVAAERSDHALTLTLADRTVVRARRVISCPGLHADRVATLVHGREPSVTILPFRGEYHALVPPRSELVRGLVYPVPDPQFPFLGVHLTRDVHGDVHIGPNAVLALGREAYVRAPRSPSTARSAVTLLAEPSVRALARRHWRAGAGELLRSRSRRSFARAAAALVPGITAADLRPHPSGIRAQAVRRDGTLLDDFAFQVDDLAVSVLNAPSPAATASLAIGRHVAALALRGA